MILKPYETEIDRDTLRDAVLRQVDQEELKASCGVNMSAVELADKISKLENAETHIITTDDGELVALGGVIHYPGERIGIPWMVATDIFTQHPRQALKLVLPVLSEMKAKCRALMNVVDYRNKPAIAFLDWVGFRFTRGLLLRHGGTFFQPFFMKGDLE